MLQIYYMEECGIRKKTVHHVLVMYHLILENYEALSCKNNLFLQ